MTTPKNTDNLDEQPPADYVPQNYEDATPARVVSRPKPRRKAVIPRERTNRIREKEYVHPPVKVPRELVVQMAKVSRYLPAELHNRSRFVVGNVMLQCPGAEQFAPEDLWMAIGRWHSGVRSMTEIEGVTDRHHGWQHLQRLQNALSRATNDPALKNKLKLRHNQFIVQFVKALDKALQQHFDAHPEDLMTPDEFAGMAPKPSAEEVANEPLFRKPKSKSGPKNDEIPPDLLPPVEEVQARKERGPQKAALFGARPKGDESAV